MPKNIRLAIENEDLSGLEEVRLRAMKPVVLETRNGRIVLECVATKKDLEQALDRMCEASVYA
ncbi:hypothetical protein, partial [Treponema sp. R6D11]